MDNKQQKSGFDISLEGKQDFPPKKIGVMKISKEEIEEFEVEIKKNENEH